MIKVIVTLVDAAGRTMEVPAANIDAKVITIAYGPIGAFVFERTDEKDALGRRVFRQRGTEKLTPDGGAIGGSLEVKREVFGS